MARGVSLHIGLNHVDPDAYDGWDGELGGCHNDAHAMRGVAESLGYETRVMLDDEATTADVTTAIGELASELTTGDMLLVTYSGHGSQVDDVSDDEIDSQDETWVLWDRMLIDDELAQLWSQFAAGVRIFLLSDSCHSGTIARRRSLSRLLAAPAARAMNPSHNGQLRFRVMPQDVHDRNVQTNAMLYRSVQFLAGKRSGIKMDASLLQISACQDSQLAQDGDTNGLFTGTLLEVWNDGKFTGNYREFWHAIAERMPVWQSPEYGRSGVADATFESQKPFVIEGGDTNGHVPADEISAPTVAGPDEHAYGDDPPQFEVDTGGRAYYVFEIGRTPEVLVNRPDSNTDTFYATYYEDDTDRQRLTAEETSFELPVAAWEALRDGERLYYRIGALSEATGWDDYTPSTYDDQIDNAPSLEVVTERRRPRKKARPRTHGDEDGNWWDGAGTDESETDEDAEDDGYLAAEEDSAEDTSPSEDTSDTTEDEVLWETGTSTPDGATPVTCPPEGYRFDVELIPQPDKLSCWAASMSMLVSYNQQQSVTPESLAGEVGRSLRTSYGWDMLEDVKDHFGFQEIPLPSNASLYVAPEQWCEWLGTYGPLWVTTVGAPSHAIIVHGIEGDLTPEGTTVAIMNPWDTSQGYSADPVDFDPPNWGLAYEQSFADFAADFGNLSLDDYGNWRVLYLSGNAPTRSRRRARGTVTYPSGAVFDIVDTPDDDDTDYSDPVSGGDVPLIRVKGRRDEQLSDNFQVKEFAATDGAMYARISPDLIERLQRLREHVGRALHVNSGYRHPALNKNKKGAARSQHMSGKGADIRVSGMTPLELAEAALDVMGCDIGIGLGKTYIHVDVRGMLTSWRYEGAKLSEAEFDRWVRDHCA